MKLDSVTVSSYEKNLRGDGVTMGEAQWRHAIDCLEAEADPVERKRLANIVRDEVEALERRTSATKEKLAHVAQKSAAAITQPREREVLVWQRGSSLTIRFSSFDAAFFEDLFTDRVKVNPFFRLRPADDPPPGDLTSPTRAHLKIAPALDTLGDFVAGDFVVTGVRPRAFGGQEGRESKAAFGFLSMQRISNDDEPDEPEPDENELNEVTS